MALAGVALLGLASFALIGSAVVRSVLAKQAKQAKQTKQRREVETQREKVQEACGRSQLYSEQCKQLEAETNPEAKAELAHQLAKQILTEQITMKVRGKFYPVYEIADEARPGKERIYSYLVIKDKANMPAAAAATQAFYAFDAPEIAATELFLNDRGRATQYYSFTNYANSGDATVPWVPPFRVYPMKFPDTKPMYGIKETATGQFRIVSTEVAPSGWTIVSPKPLFYAPVPVGEQFGVRGVRLS